jgi:glycosyltransferase involved in cell wall biosynthesis
MRVLLITPTAPSATHVNGGATRIHRLYRGLIERGHGVSVIAPFTPAERGNVAKLEAEGFDVQPLLRPHSRLSEAAWALLRRPALLRSLARESTKQSIAAIFWVDLLPLVRRALATGDYDVVVIEQSFAANWRGDLDTDLPVVLVTQEVESPHLLTKGARLGGLGGFMRYLNGARTRRSEKYWTPRFDGVIVTSAAEAQTLEQIVGATRLPHVQVVGNGTDIGPFDDLAPDPAGRRVLFTGTLAYPPNTVGAAWLAQRVWPLVLRQVPDAELLIVGACPPRSVRALAALPGVDLHADVPDMRPWFEAASVGVLPMLEGGGTRLKLLDAFAARRAVVATTNGATGIDCENGRELLVADSPEDFAHAIVRLLADEKLRALLANRGNQLARTKYDWKILSGDLEFALEAVRARVEDEPSLLKRTAGE